MKDKILWAITSLAYLGIWIFLCGAYEAPLACIVGSSLCLAWVWIFSRVNQEAVDAGIGTALAALPDTSQKLIADREAGRRAKDEEYRQLAEANRRALEASVKKMEEEHAQGMEEWRQRHEDAGDLDEFMDDPVAFTLRQLEGRTKEATE